MGIQGAQSACLHPAEDNTVGCFIHRVQEKVSVRVPVRGEGPVPPWVNKRSITGQIMFLDISQVFEEPCVMMCPVRSIVQCVHPPGPLETTPIIPVEEGVQLCLFDQIIDGLADVIETIDSGTRDMGDGYHDLLVFRDVCHFICPRYSVTRTTHGRIVRWAVPPGSPDVKIKMKIIQALSVLLRIYHCIEPHYTYD